MSADNETLRRRLKEERINLQFIQERKSQFVLQTDIPLSLLKEEQIKIALIAELEAALKPTGRKTASLVAKPATTPEDLLAHPEPGTNSRRGKYLIQTLRDQAWQGVAALIGLVALGVAVGAWLLPDIGWPPGPTPTPTFTTSPTAVFTPTLTATVASTSIATSTSTPSVTPTAPPTASPSPTRTPIPTPMGQPINADTAARIGAIEPPLDETMGPIAAIAFTDDGALYATGWITPAYQLWLWQVDPATIPFTLTATSYARAGVAFSRDGQKLAWSIGQGDQVAIWNTSKATTPSIIQPWEANDQRFKDAKVLSLAFSADGLTLACGTNKGRVALVRLDDAGRPNGLFYEDSRSVEVLGVAFAPENERPGLSLATVLGWRVRQWTIQPITMQLISRRDISPKSEGGSSAPPVFSLTFSPHGNLLAAVIQPRGGVQLWTTDSWTQQNWLAGGTDIVFPEEVVVAGEFPGSFPNGVPRGDNVKFSPDGSIIASWIRDKEGIRENYYKLSNRIRLWRVSDGQILANTKLIPFGISGLAFSPDGVTLAVGTWGGLIYQWRVY